MCFRYSSDVVAPMHCSSPRASAGFSIVLASIAPSAAPAPTTWWISSMNRMISPSAFRISSITAFSLSSNSPLNLLPATIDPTSSEITFRSFTESGTSPAIIRCAKPSAMAVFPTPASPIITGLFLVLRVRIWMTLLISISRPITGSNFPCSARVVRSVLYFCRDWYRLSACGSVTLCVPRISCNAWYTFSFSTPNSLKMSGVSPSRSSTAATKRWSTPMSSSRSRFISSPARSSRADILGVM